MGAVESEARVLATVEVENVVAVAAVVCVVTVCIMGMPTELMDGKLDNAGVLLMTWTCWICPLGPITLQICGVITCCGWATWAYTICWPTEVCMSWGTTVCI